MFNDSFHFNKESATSKVKLNCYEIIEQPNIACFETDIKKWNELKELAKNEVIVGLYKNKIYSFSSEEELNKVFGPHILNSISIDVPTNELIRDLKEVYIGILLQLIGKGLLSKGFAKCDKDKYFLPETKKFDNQFICYDAFEVGIVSISNHMCLIINPTIFITNRDGSFVCKNNATIFYNKKIGELNNQNYASKLAQINQKIISNGNIELLNGEFKISAKSRSIGNFGVSKFDTIKLDEPNVSFSYQENERCIKQLDGLRKYGPLDYIKNENIKNDIRLSIICPIEAKDVLIGHLECLNKAFSPQYDKKYLPEYLGFENIYHKKIIIPKLGDRNLITYEMENVIRLKSKSVGFYNSIKKHIDIFVKDGSSDLLIIYVPNKFNEIKNDEKVYEDFDLHDAVKNYAMKKGLAVQFIEQKSINFPDKCKVMWALSTGIYAKTGGQLWNTSDLSDGTIYVGMGYSISKRNGICISCSQVFDSFGIGLKMFLKKVKNPEYLRKNPYMGTEEMQVLMTEIREQYYRSNPSNKIKRVVVQKNTQFTLNEIKGIKQAFGGIENVELIQVQNFSLIRGISITESMGLDRYPIERGICAKISDESLLLWTQGTVNDRVFNGKYNRGKGIPIPIVLTRFMGTSSAETIAKETLALTKMNWNCGDTMFKSLPVSIDYASVLSRMSKQQEMIFDVPYDFRFFM